MNSYPNQKSFTDLVQVTEPQKTRRMQWPQRSIAIIMVQLSAMSILSCSNTTGAGSVHSADGGNEPLQRFIGGLAAGVMTQAGGGSVGDAALATQAVMNAGSSGEQAALIMAPGFQNRSVSADITPTTNPVAAGGGGKPNLLTGSLRGYLQHADVQVQTMAEAAELNYQEYTRTGNAGHYEAHRLAVQNLQAMIPHIGNAPALGR